MARSIYLVILLTAIGSLACGPKCRIFKEAKEPMVTFNRNLEKRGCACAQMGTEGPDLYCSRVGRPEVILEGIEREIEPGETIAQLKLSDCTLPRLPDGLFLSRPALALHLERTSLLALTYGSFAGSQDTLKSIHISDNPFVASWDWGALNLLRNLQDLIIANCELPSISRDQTSNLPSSLVKFYLNFNKIERLEPLLFIDTNLTTISLFSNQIVYISENVFPATLNSLLLGLIMCCRLSKNRLSSLPPTLLEDTPYLVLLDIRQNNFVHLDSRGFQIIMIEEFFEKFLKVQLEDNPLDCCRLSWFLDSELQNAGILSGKCGSPAGLKGQDIDNVSLMSVTKHCPKFSPL